MESTGLNKVSWPPDVIVTVKSQIERFLGWLLYRLSLRLLCWQCRRAGCGDDVRVRQHDHLAVRCAEIALPLIATPQWIVTLKHAMLA